MSSVTPHTLTWIKDYREHLEEEKEIKGEPGRRVEKTTRIRTEEEFFDNNLPRDQFTKSFQYRD